MTTVKTAKLYRENVLFQRNRIENIYVWSQKVLTQILAKTIIILQMQ